MLSLDELRVISRRADEQRDISPPRSLSRPRWCCLSSGRWATITTTQAKLPRSLPRMWGRGVTRRLITPFCGMASHNSVRVQSSGEFPGRGEMSQLTRYFNNTDADIGILTNGVVYKFFSDLDKPNIMDQSPFLVVDISKANQGVVADLQRFAKDSFDPEETKPPARRRSSSAA